jgi:hypothetical protein
MIQGSGRVQGLVFGVNSLGFNVWGHGIGVEGEEFKN